MSDLVWSRGKKQLVKGKWRDNIWHLLKDFKQHQIDNWPLHRVKDCVKELLWKISCNFFLLFLSCLLSCCLLSLAIFNFLFYSVSCHVGIDEYVLSASPFKEIQGNIIFHWKYDWKMKPFVWIKSITFSSLFSPKKHNVIIWYICTFEHIVKCQLRSTMICRHFWLELNILCISIKAQY